MTQVNPHITGMSGSRSFCIQFSNREISAWLDIQGIIANTDT